MAVIGHVACNDGVSGTGGGDSSSTSGVDTTNLPTSEGTGEPETASTSVPGGSESSGSTGDTGDTGSGVCDGHEVLARNGCTGCHGGSALGGLDLRPLDFDARLVGAPSNFCDVRVLIDPLAPQNSHLLRVLEPPVEHSLCNVAMPPAPFLPMSEDDIECLEDWLAAEFADGVRVPEFEPVQIESAVTKVKLLVHGGAPTAQELIDAKLENGLRGLLEKWVKTPEFERKTADMMRLLLQQQRRPSEWAQIDGFNHGGVPQQLAAAMEESAVRTATKLVITGSPLHALFTTRTWEVTPAQLVLMRYADQTTAERAKLDHHVVLDAVDAPADLPDSIAKGRWYTPGVDPKCREKYISMDNPDGTKLGVEEILRFQWGHLRCLGLQDHRFYADAELKRNDPMSEDFTVFRPVQFLQADPDEPLAEPAFFDLPAWRDKNRTKVKSRLPRAGFMTTPAFLNTWGTNTANDFRVTINQTLIVALHGTFRVGEPTVPLHTEGLFVGHNSDKAPECIGCHIQMDPMRNWFKNAFDANYQSVTVSPYVKGGFAFGDYTAEDGDFDAFAKSLTMHPMLAAAWTQKLCWIANAGPCDPSDQKFRDVANVFRESNFNWETLVIELFSSPLVTGLAPPGTWTGRDIPISMLRGQHTCAAIDVRAGGRCDDKKLAPLLDVIPTDGFSRATVNPDVPVATNAFSLAGREQLCMGLADQLIPKIYSPNQADAVTRIVEEFVGLPTSHGRHKSMVDGLTAHFDEVKPMVADEVAALKSAFILGCTSPDAASMGL